MDYILSKQAQKLIVRIYKEHMYDKTYLFEPTDKESDAVSELSFLLYIEQHYESTTDDLFASKPTGKYHMTGLGVQEARRLINLQHTYHTESRRYWITTIIAILALLVAIYSIYLSKYNLKNVNTSKHQTNVETSQIVPRPTQQPKYKTE